MNIILEEKDPDRIKTLIYQGLQEYNMGFLGTYERKNFAIYTNDQNAKTIAAIYGFIIEKPDIKTMRIEFFWVDKVHRRLGIGTKFMQYLEELAVTKNCQSIQVTTLEFQAADFYKKMGYIQIGLIPKWFCDNDEIFFSKNLVAKD